MAVADASFNTENDSISSTGISFRLRSTPSTSTRALALAPKVLIPRIQNSLLFSPGSPDSCCVMMPGTTPPSALLRLPVGAFRCLVSTVVKAPVRVFFFCEPLAVTTTSSTFWLSSSIFTLTLLGSLMFTTGRSRVLKPMYVICSTSYLLALILNCPSMSVVEPSPGLFFITTTAPVTGSP